MKPLNFLARIGSRSHFRPNETTAALIDGEEIAGIKLGVAVRITSIIAVNLFNLATFLYWAELKGSAREFITSPEFLEMLYDMSNTLPFLIIGFIHLGIVYFRPSWRWILYLTVLLDAIFLPMVWLIPSPFQDTVVPQALILRTSLFNYYYVMAVIVALTYSPWLMMWFGACVVVVWNSLAFWLGTLPGAVIFNEENTDPAMTVADILAIYLDPNYVDSSKAIEQTVIFMIASIGLAVAVHRSRKLVFRSVGAEVQKNNLSRYFSPKVAARLTEQGGAVGQAQKRKVAILFADIVGFTGLAEDKTPEGVLDLLRDFHGRMEAQVFAHDGTLEKYIGDALLATFGTPEPGSHDASDALKCAMAMQRELQAWNAQRIASGQRPVRACIGIHYGEAVMGNIGRDRNMAFVVVGGSVNIASRLQTMGRHLDAGLVISEALAREVLAEAVLPADCLTEFTLLENQKLRGMQMSVDLRYLPGLNNS